ncbi:MAG: hypothetical protein SPL51_05235 [Lachnospiraceae bacterium]|nr:hypothetical protein [Lachnospiraceae bacterium]
MKKYISRIKLFMNLNLKIYIITFVALMMSDYSFMYNEKNISFMSFEFSKADVFMLSVNGYYSLALAVFVYLIFINYNHNNIERSAMLKFKNFNNIWICKCVALMVKTLCFTLIFMLSEFIIAMNLSDGNNCNFNSTRSIFYYINEGKMPGRNIKLSYIIWVSSIYIFILFMAIGMINLLMNWLEINKHISLIVTIFLVIIVQVTGIINTYNLSYDKLLMETEWIFMYLAIVVILSIFIGSLYCRKKECINA